MILIVGFLAFSYHGIWYQNPSANIAKSLGGIAIEADWNAVEALDFGGRPVLGIGLDPSLNHAVIDSRAFGLSSEATSTNDAGRFECGHLLYRALQSNPCSLFVHVPERVGEEDMETIYDAVRLIEKCERTQDAQVSR